MHKWRIILVFPWREVRSAVVDWKFAQLLRIVKSLVKALRKFCSAWFVCTCAVVMVPMADFGQIGTLLKLLIPSSYCRWFITQVCKYDATSRFADVSVARQITLLADETLETLDGIWSMIKKCCSNRYDQHLTHCILRARGDPGLVSQSDPVISFMTAWRQPNQRNINIWTRLNQFCSKFCSHGNGISRNLAAGTMVDLSSWYEGMDQSDANIDAQAIFFDFIHSSTSTFKMKGCCTSQLMWGPRNFGGTGIVDKFWDAAVVLDVFPSCSQNHILSASNHGSMEILDVELSYELAFPLRYVCLGCVGYVMLHDNLPLNP